MKFKILFAILALVSFAFAASGDPTKFGYNNTTTVTLGGVTGNGTFSGNVSAVTFYGNLAWSYLTSIPGYVINYTSAINSVNDTVNALVSSNNTTNLRVDALNTTKLQNGSNANLSGLTVTGGNVVVTAGNITYVDRNSKTRVIQDTTEGYDEMTTNTLLDRSRSSLSCSGSKLNYTLTALNGKGEWVFNGTYYGGDEAVPSASVTLLNGTNTTPKTNYVYFYLNGTTPTLTVSESDPTGVCCSIIVGVFVVGETSGSNCVVYSYSRERFEIDAFVNRVITRINAQGTLYTSGFDTTASTKTINIGTGNFFNGLFAMFTNVSRNSTTDGFYLINSTGNFLQKATFDSATFGRYATGGAVSDDRYVSVVWGIVPTTTTAGGTTATVPKLVAVLQSEPAIEYASRTAAEQDLYGMTNYYPPNSAVKEVFTPIAKQILRIRTGGGGTGTAETLSNGLRYADLRGKVTSGGGAPVPSTNDHATLTNLDYANAGHTGFASTTYADGLYNTLNATKAQAGVCGANEWMQSTTNTSAPTCLQIGFLNVSGTVTDAQMANQKLNVSDVGTAIGNTTIARTGSSTTCGAGEWMVNATTTTTGITSVCTAIPVYNNGTVTSITAGTGLTGGVITSTGTFAINDTYISDLMGNATIARTGTAACSAGEVAQNVTTTTSGMTSECVALSTGTVTSVATDETMTGGTITTTGTLGVNSSVVALQNQSNTFTLNQTFSANITVGASVGRILLGNGGYIDFNTTCTMTCFNATICSKIGPGC